MLLTWVDIVTISITTIVWLALLLWADITYKGVWVKFFIILLPMFIFGLVVPREKITDQELRQKIFSINASKNFMNGQFVLGTGYIDTREVYLAEIQNRGGYTRFYIPVVGTIKYEDKHLKNEGLYVEQLCATRSKISDWIDPNYKKGGLHRCETQTPERELYVPEGTIVQKFNL